MPDDGRRPQAAVPITSTNVTNNVTNHVTSAAPDAGGGPESWHAGTHFSRYEIDSRLAAGGMAEVWRAKLKGVRGFEKRIVIKTMLPHLAGRTDLVEMFINEATVAAGFSHPNIAHVFDFGQLEGRYFIAMEYVSGVTLRFAHKRMLGRGELLPRTTALHVLIDLCDALHEVHEAADGDGPLGLIHRDLSPDNVIVSTSGAAKLIDFGAARATRRTPTPSVFVGKYRYAAPERIRRAFEDRRSDVYSAGVILYECLTGRRPHEGSDQEVIRSVESGRLRDPREHEPSLPDRLAAAVLRAIAHTPGDRFASARELRHELGACLAELGPANREQDVTAALAALIETPDPASIPTPPPPVEAVPVAVGSGETASNGEPTSGVDVALCEVEIIEASGPINMGPTPPPLPVLPSRARLVVPPTPPPVPRSDERSAPHWSRPGQLFDRVFGGAPNGAPQGTPQVLGWRRATEQSPATERSPAQRAVELFDRGLELRAARRYGEALQAWERALALAPENNVYRANVTRLREQLDALRRAEHHLADWDHQPD